ncbi:OmpA family protein [Candidatus Laterigemmans baculatus]|uniref:OmpA family protein n=1 Tax=Candidatus Laterigemmans baculatus TaxID=2770505 RepID=UPI001F2550EC|nr:OmpA family protein [Candidatus Laterigemmans baculatus]
MRVVRNLDEPMLASSAGGRTWRLTAALSIQPLAGLAVSLLFLAALAGCTHRAYPLGPGYPAGNPWGPAAPPNVSPLEAQVTELQRRVQLLDEDNRQLQTQLAQSEQQSLVYRDEVNLMRQQLADTAERLEQARIAADQSQQHFKGLQASTQFRGGATLEANTNLRQIAEAMRASGLPVVYEGDAARVLVPTDQLFQPGTAQLLPQASGLLTPIATQIVRLAPRQRIGVEGFTDDAPLYGGQFSSPHQLTSAQALSVFELLAERGGIAREQMTTTGHGASSPRQPNQTAAGRSANRRIEIVIYPSTM